MWEHCRRIFNSHGGLNMHTYAGIHYFIKHTIEGMILCIPDLDIRASVPKDFNVKRDLINYV